MSRKLMRSPGGNIYQNRHQQHRRKQAPTPATDSSDFITAQPTEMAPTASSETGQFDSGFGCYSSLRCLSSANRSTNANKCVSEVGTKNAQTHQQDNNGRIGSGRTGRTGYNSPHNTSRDSRENGVKPSIRHSHRFTWHLIWFWLLISMAIMILLLVVTLCCFVFIMPPDPKIERNISLKSAHKTPKNTNKKKCGIAVELSKWFTGGV